MVKSEVRFRYFWADVGDGPEIIGLDEGRYWCMAWDCPIPPNEKITIIKEVKFEE